MRLLKTRQGAFAMGAQIIFKEGVVAALGSINNKRAHARQSVIVKAFDHRGGAHRFMTQQNILDFNWRDPLARRLKAIIAAAHVPPETVLVAAIEIARAHPTSDEGLRSGFGSLPIPNCCAVTANPEIPHFARRSGHTSMIDQASFVTSEQLSAAAIAHLAFVI